MSIEIDTLEEELFKDSSSIDTIDNLSRDNDDSNKDSDSVNISKLKISQNTIDEKKINITSMREEVVNCINKLQ